MAEPTPIFLWEVTILNSILQCLLFDVSPLSMGTDERNVFAPSHTSQRTSKEAKTVCEWLFSWLQNVRIHSGPEYPVKKMLVPGRNWTREQIVYVEWRAAESLMWFVQILYLFLKQSFQMKLHFSEKKFQLGVKPNIEASFEFQRAVKGRKGKKYFQEAQVLI